MNDAGKGSIYFKGALKVDRGEHTFLKTSGKKRTGLKEGVFALLHDIRLDGISEKRVHGTYSYSLTSWLLYYLRMSLFDDALSIGQT